MLLKNALLHRKLLGKGYLPWPGCLIKLKNMDIFLHLNLSIFRCFLALFLKIVKLIFSSDFCRIRENNSSSESSPEILDLFMGIKWMRREFGVLHASKRKIFILNLDFIKESDKMAIIFRNLFSSPNSFQNLKTPSKRRLLTPTTWL